MENWMYFSEFFNVLFDFNLYALANIVKDIYIIWDYKNNGKI